MLGWLLRTRETVACETPACRAMSRLVNARRSAEPATAGGLPGLPARPATVDHQYLSCNHPGLGAEEVLHRADHILD